MAPSKTQFEYPLDKLKKVIRKWLYLEDDNIIDVLCAALIANQFQTDPLWMIFIAPPSHAKTELLRAFDGNQNVYYLSNLTPATLVSGLKKQKNQDEPSLLLKLDKKTLILKDFTTVLSMRSENQQEILSQLREIYDGQYSKAFGNGKRIHWKGRVGLVAACTPVYDKHYGIIGQLGERFLLYRTGNKDGKKMGLKALEVVGNEDIMREEIKNAFHSFLSQFKNLKDLHFEKEINTHQMVTQLACFCAFARCPVDRDYRDQHIRYLPEPEGPARLVKQLIQVGMGLALVHGKTTIDNHIYDIIRKIGQDLVPAMRFKMLRLLWEERTSNRLGKWLRTKTIADKTSIPAMTTKLVLEDLMIVKLLNRSRSGDGEKAPYEWKLSAEANEMIEESCIFPLSETGTQFEAYNEMGTKQSCNPVGDFEELIKL